ncbi:hypothetical protein MMMDOFMJ_1354 [Methylobacterium gnaphalii]|nr:hypothetical protein MMMDOFMJ_1354 [Methylobacterium gnaphalii]GLS50558.1 hypothetical protein GCM10007885_34110 [Methylobacterium gnaphalii]
MPVRPPCIGVAIVAGAIIITPVGGTATTAGDIVTITMAGVTVTTAGATTTTTMVGAIVTAGSGAQLTRSRIASLISSASTPTR